MNAKSQIHMVETLMVLAVFFILLVIFYAFYSNTSAGIDAERNGIRQLEAVKITKQASSLVEIECSERGVVMENCIDLLKVDEASEIIGNEENKRHYSGKFGFSKITIKQIYPEIKDIAMVYDNSLDEFSYKDVSNIPVSLFNPLKNKYYFGAITVEVFSK